MTSLPEPLAKGLGGLGIHGLGLGDVTGRKAETQGLGFNLMG